MANNRIIFSTCNNWGLGRVSAAYTPSFAAVGAEYQRHHTFSEPWPAPFCLSRFGHIFFAYP